MKRPEPDSQPDDSIITEIPDKKGRMPPTHIFETEKEFWDFCVHTLCLKRNTITPKEVKFPLGTSWALIYVTREAYFLDNGCLEIKTERSRKYTDGSTVKEELKLCIRSAMDKEIASKINFQPYTALIKGFCLGETMVPFVVPELGEHKEMSDSFEAADYVLRKGRQLMRDKILNVAMAVNSCFVHAENVVYHNTEQRALRLNLCRPIETEDVRRGAWQQVYEFLVDEDMKFETDEATRKNIAQFLSICAPSAECDQDPKNG